MLLHCKPRSESSLNARHSKRVNDYMLLICTPDSDHIIVHTSLYVTLCTITLDDETRFDLCCTCVMINLTYHLALLGD